MVIIKQEVMLQTLTAQVFSNKKIKFIQRFVGGYCKHLESECIKNKIEVKINKKDLDSIFPIEADNEYENNFIDDMISFNQ